MSCATRAASPSGASTRKITNSSPPMRETWAPSVNISERRSPMTRSTSSPAAWPNESLISLKRSRSMKSRSTEAAAPSSMRRFRRSSSSRRLMRPVSSSCVAWRDKRSEIARASVTSRTSTMTPSSHGNARTSNQERAARRNRSRCWAYLSRPPADRPFRRLTR